MKFFSKFVFVVLLLVIAFVVGMISPGEWLTERQHEVQKFYQSMRFRNVPIADDFCPTPFDLKITSTVNQESGKLETYLINNSEMLPILYVEGTTQVGDATYRLKGLGGDLKGLGEEGRDKLKNLWNLLND